MLVLPFFVCAAGALMQKVVLNIVDLAGSETSYQPYKATKMVKSGDYDPYDKPNSFGPLSPRLQQQKTEFQQRVCTGLPPFDPCVCVRVRMCVCTCVRACMCLPGCVRAEGAVAKRQWPGCRTNEYL